MHISSSNGRAMRVFRFLARRDHEISGMLCITQRGSVLILQWLANVRTTQQAFSILLRHQLAQCWLKGSFRTFIWQLIISYPFVDHLMWFELAEDMSHTLPFFELTPSPFGNAVVILIQSFSNLYKAELAWPLCVKLSSMVISRQ